MSPAADPLRLLGWSTGDGDQAVLGWLAASHGSTYSTAAPWPWQIGWVAGASHVGAGSLVARRNGGGRIGLEAGQELQRQAAALAFRLAR